MKLAAFADTLGRILHVTFKLTGRVSVRIVVHVHVANERALDSLEADSGAIRSRFLPHELRKVTVPDRELGDLVAVKVLLGVPLLHGSFRNI